MVGLEEVLEIHQILGQQYGSFQGVREIRMLQSALRRTFSEFGTIEFYKTHITKAVGVLESIIKNHPFVDENNHLIFRRPCSKYSPKYCKNFCFYKKN